MFIATNQNLSLLKTKGRLENFGLLKGEDNERWLISIVNVLRGGGLRLVSSFDSYEIQYFTKFFLNGVTYLDPHRFSLGDKSSVLSLNVLSNAYVLLLISCVFLTIKICLQIFNYLGIKSSSFLFIIVIAVFSRLPVRWAFSTVSAELCCSYFCDLYYSIGID